MRLMGLADTEREPPKIVNGRVPINVDPDSELMDAEDAAINAAPGLPDGEFRLDAQDGNPPQVHSEG